MPEDDLAALALAADPDTEVADDAVPFSALTRSEPSLSLLPEWYMPAPTGEARLRGWRRRVAWLIVASLLAILAAGLCSTYGVVVPA